MPNPTTVSYAQNGEDVVLARALAHVENGRYIDVGANHPQWDSVTFWFYQRGWSGLTVEPIAELAHLHRSLRPRDRIFEGVVADTDSPSLTLHAFDDSGLSTLVDDLRDRHLADGRGWHDVVVPAARLDDLLADIGWEDEPIHFMSVDTEGAEAQVLASIDLARWRPWILVVEATEPNSTVQTQGAWEPGLLAAGYTFALFDGLSRYYVADEHAARLGPALSYPACILDDYVTWHLDLARRRNDELQATLADLGTQADASGAWRRAALEGWLDVVARATDEVALARAAAADARAQTAAARAELDAERHVVTGLFRERALLAEELESHRATLSWRVTKPLRSVRRLGRSG